MNAAQKIIAGSTLLGISLFMHLFYCNWLVANPSTLDSTVNGGGERTIVQFGSNSGILSRSRETVSSDALLGIAIPGLMIGAAFYIFSALGRHRVNLAVRQEGSFLESTSMARREGPA